MNHTSLITNINFINSNGNEFVANPPVDKRPIEQPTDSAAKRVKRHIEKQQKQKIVNEIAKLITQAEKPGNSPHKLAKLERDIATKKLEEFKIIHSHLKADATKLYERKKLVETELQNTKSEMDTLAAVAHEYACESDRRLSEHAQEKQAFAEEKSAFKEEIEQLNADLNLNEDIVKSLEQQIQSLEYQVVTSKLEYRILASMYESQHKKWVETVEEMKVQHAQELEAKDVALEDALTQVSGPREPALRRKIASLVAENAALKHEIKEISDSAASNEAELVYLRKASARLSELKHESDSKYHALLNNPRN